MIKNQRNKNIAIVLTALFVFIGLMPMKVHAQLFDQMDKASSKTSSASIQTQPVTSTPIQDGPVDPKEYIVGPGDVFSIGIWTSPPLLFQQAITPEGSIIVPNVGEMAITGKTLDEAKKFVLSAIKKRFISAEISFTLTMPRAFTVTVKGAVPQEGAYVVQATERVDALLQKMSMQFSASSKSVKTIEPKIDSIVAKRNIVVRHKDGTSNNVDIEKYFAEHNVQHNPLLRDGDVVYFPKKNLEKDFIAVYGAVNKEGAIEFAESDRVSTALLFAVGLTPLADSTKAFIMRTEDDGKTVITVPLSLRDFTPNSAADIILKRGDRVVVQEKENLLRDKHVVVEGEVRHPGTYPIARDSAMLSAILAQAGGFTPYASLTSAAIFRNVKPDKKKNNEFTQEYFRGKYSSEDTAYFNNEAAIRSSRELVSADFTALFIAKDFSKDVVLHDGDHIIIPSHNKNVYVFGQVVHPGYVPFVQGQSIAHYIANAGGYAEDAVKSDIRIIKAGTKQWVSVGETTIEEGDYIWIPKAPYRSFGYYLGIYSQVFGIVGTVATLYLLTKK